MVDTNQNFEDLNYDVFNDDDNNSNVNVAEQQEQVGKEADTDDEPNQDNQAESKEASESETGEKQEAEAPPAEANQNDEAEQSEKMIPESRLKAALKSVTDERDEARAELARAKAQPAPDRNTDPDGYDLHVRMEASKAIMIDAYSDYDEVIAHYQEMEKANPFIAEVVAKHPAPAKHAYDLAKKDMEIRELTTLKGSDEWKEFQEFRNRKAAEQSAAAKAAAEATKAAISNEPGPKKEEVGKVVPAIPNLNRATDVSGKQLKSQDDDEELFAGAL